MTRVLMTADTVGGVWTYALELADALAPRGVQVHLATMGRRMTADQRAELAQSAVLEAHESDFALEWQADPWADVDRAGQWLLELESAVEPDVVHLNGYAHATLPWQAPTVVVAHSDVVSWWRAVRGEDAPAEWDLYRQQVTAGLDAATAVVAPTDAVLQDLAVSYGWSGGVVIPNCRRGDWVHEQVKEPFILGSGRVWDEAKGLQALDSLRLDWPVQVAGDGGSVGRLPFGQLAELLMRAAVFAAPSFYEPFGLGILEAALAGCALVLGDIASLREVWQDAALYVPPGDASALEAVLSALVSDPKRLRELGSRSRRRAVTYAPERAASSYADLYARLPVRAGSR
jgi:glycosyltransferase involved in cell wall biosynthesis